MRCERYSNVCQLVGRCDGKRGDVGLAFGRCDSCQEVWQF